MIPKLWLESDNNLEREFLFEDFRSAFSFLEKVVDLAEQHKHHPNINWRYNRIKLQLSTHDEGGVVTAKDLNLAEAINKLT